jgi:hypothetical protein
VTGTVFGLSSGSLETIRTFPSYVPPSRPVASKWTVKFVLPGPWIRPDVGLTVSHCGTAWMRTARLSCT